MPARRDARDAYTRWREIDYQPVVRDLPSTALVEHLRPGQRIIEIGCGTGTNVVRMARHGFAVEGWDINPAAIAKAQEKIFSEQLENSVSLVAGDFLDCAELPSIADAIVMIRVLTCVPELSQWQRLLDRARACIRSGGFLYVRDFLHSPENYAERYERGRQLGWRSGAFAVPADRDPPEFIAYHHAEADLDVICAPYRLVSLRREQGRSLSGNRTNMFELLAQKP